MVEAAVNRAPAELEVARGPAIGDFRVELTTSERRRGVVVITDGSASCGTSLQSRFSARLLRDRGLDTALVDLSCTGRSDAEAALLEALGWVRERVPKVPIAIYGCESGVPGVLGAAFRENVSALVMRGSFKGALDADFSRLSVPTLLIVGSRDLPGIEKARRALDRIVGGAKRLEIVPGTNGRFDEPGTLAAATLLTARWCIRSFGGSALASVQ